MNSLANLKSKYQNGNLDYKSGWLDCIDYLVYQSKIAETAKTAILFEMADNVINTQGFGNDVTGEAI